MVDAYADTLDHHECASPMASLWDVPPTCGDYEGIECSPSFASQATRSTPDLTLLAGGDVTPGRRSSTESLDVSPTLVLPFTQPEPKRRRVWAKATVDYPAPLCHEVFTQALTPSAVHGDPQAGDQSTPLGNDSPDGEKMSAADRKMYKRFNRSLLAWHAARSACGNWPWSSVGRGFPGLMKTGPKNRMVILEAWAAESFVNTDLKAWARGYMIKFAEKGKQPRSQFFFRGQSVLLTYQGAFGDVDLDIWSVPAFQVDPFGSHRVHQTPMALELLVMTPHSTPWCRSFT